MIRSFQGSSPLARGLPASRPSQRLLRRIIPARAGFTRMRGGRLPRPRDHPRSRGVYGARFEPGARDRGSSPLARGLQEASVRLGGEPRIIPARAGFTAPPSAPAPESADHPRSRGVYRVPTHSSPSRPGSSPLARGLHACHQSRPFLFGIIPARAGFTTRRARSASSWPDHPRSRGVYVPEWVGGQPVEGSSPLARGLPARLAEETADAGIIPARAGFTRRPPPPARARADHPRSRGVYMIPRVASPGSAGSSPLARGLPDGGGGRADGRGIIPARAGFTRRRHGGGRGRPDHPRSRGVYKLAGYLRNPKYGSSPLARGLRRRWWQSWCSFRIIPARAGFTDHRRPPDRGRRDHPRSRGVYWRPGAPPGRAPGSSPLARGLPLELALLGVDDRIIPARAGFTSHQCSPWFSWWDHPRSRGVYESAPLPTRARGGSSPLARGLPGAVHHGPRMAGIIPARAGFTGCDAPGSRVPQDHPRSRGVYPGR